MDFLFNLPHWRRKSPPGQVNVLVAMADPVARRSVRQAVLRSMPANAIEADGKSTLHHAVTFQEIDLIIADAEMNGYQSYDIVEQIRYGRLHCHAFPVVVMLCDRSNETCMQRVIDCGADLVIPSAVAARMMPEQLEKLSRRRKPFLVVPHYIGPDRRDSDRGDACSPDHLLVPNPLAPRGDDKAEADYRREISVASHRLNLMRRGLYQIRFEAARLAAAPSAV